MATDLVRIAEATGYNRAQVELVKDTIARGASDDELMLFLHLAQRSGLDPFARQIYLIERRANVNGEWRTSRQPQTGIDGLRLIADRTDRYAPGREPAFTYDEQGRLATATSYVRKWVRGEWHEVAATAHYGEYVQAKKDGTPTQMWADKPHIMLAKCAEALALRRAFPAELSGLYTADEMRDETPATLPPRPQANHATGEVITVEALPVPAGRDLLGVKRLCDEVRQLGGDPGTITPAALKAMADAEFASYTEGLRLLRDRLQAGETEEQLAA
jgi:phage recombination protein Bet